MTIRLMEDATLTLTRRGMDSPPVTESVAEMIHFMTTSVKATPNKHRPSTFILRKQCAFLLPNAPFKEYRFGQVQDTFVFDDTSSPKLLRLVVDYVHRHHSTEYDLFQCNYYKDASVGISPHKDDEACLNSDKDILSFSFYEAEEESRAFSIYSLGDAKLLDVMLGHGDVLVMSPEVQQCVKHGVDKERANKCGPRLNITARVLKTPSPPP